MKSPAVLGFILFVAASANATLMISVNGVIEPPLAEIELQPDETAIIDIHGDGLTPPPVTALLVVTGPGSIDGHTMVYRGSLSSYEDLPPLVIIGMFPIPWPIDVSLIVFADAAIPQAPLDGLLVDNIIFHCDALGDVQLALIGDDFATVYDTQMIQQIPEPMTLLLLGLGGLFAVARHGRKQWAKPHWRKAPR